MWGLFFTACQEFVTQKLGTQRWEELRDKVGLPNFVVPLVDYPDAALSGLMQEMSQATGRMVHDVEQEFGRTLVAQFTRLYAYYFSRRHNARDFLLDMDEIHEQAGRLQRGTSPPRLVCHSPSPGSLEIEYRSQRRLCSMLKGLIEGVAAHYGEPVRIQTLACMKNGAPACRLLVGFGATQGWRASL